VIKFCSKTFSELVLGRCFTRCMFRMHCYRVFTRSSKLPANVFKIHVNCWTFAGSCKHPISASDVCGFRLPAECAIFRRRDTSTLTCERPVFFCSPMIRSRSADSQSVDRVMTSMRVNSTKVSRYLVFDSFTYSYCPLKPQVLCFEL